ncbi:nucleic acid-binding protein [Lichtheimia hyalospora FSU 10163]|nr:nucleic acid-binding protein [Lichtheimia hyalospora FSU 10163]
MEWDNGGNNSNASNVTQQQQQRQPNNKVQTIQPVTIKQVTMAKAYADGSVIFIDDKEISTITFIGVIRSCESSSTGYTYTVEDGTGSIRVRQWDTEEEEDIHHVNPFRQVEEGMYVRVYGRIHRYGDKTNCLAFALRSITNFNELTFHCMDAILAHILSRSHNSMQNAKDDPMDISFTSGVLYQENSLQFKLSSHESFSKY